MKIYINGLRQEVRIGVTKEERSFPQILTLDLEIKGDFLDAIKKDDLSLTLDYTAVCQEITKYIQDKEWQLMEKFVYDLAVFTGGLDSVVEEVKLKACKNVMTQVDSISVSYKYKKNEVN